MIRFDGFETTVDDVSYVHFAVSSQDDEEDVCEFCCDRKCHPIIERTARYPDRAQEAPLPGEL